MDFRWCLAILVATCFVLCLIICLVTDWITEKVIGAKKVKEKLVKCRIENRELVIENETLKAKLDFYKLNSKEK